MHVSDYVKWWRVINSKSNLQWAVSAETTSQLRPFIPYFSNSYYYFLKTWEFTTKEFNMK